MERKGILECWGIMTERVLDIFQVRFSINTTSSFIQHELHAELLLATVSSSFK